MMEPLVAAGKARAIGVSNLNSSGLNALLKVAKVKPAVNQCGYSVGMHSNETGPQGTGNLWGRNDATVAACRAAGVSFSAYSPLGGWTGASVLKNPVVLSVAAAHNRSAAAVAIRWVTQQNISAVTAASKAAYAEEDYKTFEFRLTAAEMQRLSAIKSDDRAASTLDFGLNLPTRSGSSGTGAFAPGVYNLTYSAAQLQRMRSVGFTSVRLPINIATANDAAALRTIRALVEATSAKSAVICMFGTGSLTTHGTGRVDSLKDAIGAWSNVHASLGDLPNVKFEILNEPHGYAPGCNSPPCGTQESYVKDMRAIIAGAKLPEERCILDALGCAPSRPCPTPPGNGIASLQCAPPPAPPRVSNAPVPTIVQVGAGRAGAGEALGRGDRLPLLLLVAACERKPSGVRCAVLASAERCGQPHIRHRVRRLPRLEKPRLRAADDDGQQRERCPGHGRRRGRAAWHGSGHPGRVPLARLGKRRLVLVL